MTVLHDRVRRALAPDYAVEAELAQGGMGVVFSARDVTLDRPVAIKIIRPDTATANAVERFLREARILASVSHPNIVAVYRAGEADGIPYYVMEFLAGENLETRLRRGPLPEAEATQVGLDVLDALSEVHDHGIVHRDIKPSNVFLRGNRALLADFGISKASTDPGAPLTVPGAAVGTPGYMPPEQLAADDVGPATDLCAAGMLIYEAYTGRRWAFDHTADHPDWSGVPRRVAAVLAKALAWAPRDRWSSAAAFRRALVAATVRPTAGRYLVAAAFVFVAALALRFGPGARGAAPSGVTIGLRPFAVRGGGSGDTTAGLGARLAAALRDDLRGTPDFTVLDSASGASATITLGGTVMLFGDSMRVTVAPEAADAAGQNVVAQWTGPVVGWPVAVDSLHRELLVRMLTAYSHADLPADALPANPASLTQWAQGEYRWAHGMWDAAADAYRTALALDSACALCEYRLADIRRWQRLGADTGQTGRYRRELRRFPQRYQALIRAEQEPLTRRLEHMGAVTRRDPTSWMTSFRYGDELFHRGALVGEPRSQAIRVLREAVRLHPDFAPAWEHLARAAIAEGLPREAGAAILRYEAAAAQNDLTSQVLLAVNKIGFAWRFESAERGQRALEEALQSPAITMFSEVASGPRYFLSLDAPDAALWLGRWFVAQQDRAELQGPGFVAQAVASLALGRPDSAVAAARRLAARLPGVETALFAAELEAMLVAFDSADAARWPALRAELEQLARQPEATQLQRRRAAWMVTLAARHSGAAAPATPAATLQARDGDGQRPLLALLDAQATGEANPGRALALTAPLADVDSSNRVGDPFFRAALHLLRAGWAAAAHDTAAAARALRWHENSDILIVADGALAQPIDVDRGFATLARWRLADLSAAAPGGGADACAALAAVARLWAGGQPQQARRAAAAVARRRTLGCARG